jgi:hypothetical protein
MFSPNVQSDVRQTIAMSHYATIEDICVGLNEKAHINNFFDKSIAEMSKKANEFVESFAYENGMNSRTVQPLVWSFSVDGQKLYDDGLVELIIDDDASFSYTKLDKSKISQPPAENSYINGIKTFGISNIIAHQAWLLKSSEQIKEWRHVLKMFKDSEQLDLSVKLKDLESHLESILSNAKNVSKDMISEMDRKWNHFEESIDKIKKSMQKSS